MSVVRPPFYLYIPSWEPPFLRVVSPVCLCFLCLWFVPRFIYIYLEVKGPRLIVFWSVQSAKADVVPPLSFPLEREPRPCCTERGAAEPFTGAHRRLNASLRRAPSLLLRRSSTCQEPQADS